MFKKMWFLVFALLAMAVLCGTASACGACGYGDGVAGYVLASFDSDVPVGNTEGAAPGSQPIMFNEIDDRDYVVANLSGVPTWSGLNAKGIAPTSLILSWETGLPNIRCPTSV